MGRRVLVSAVVVGILLVLVAGRGIAELIVEFLWYGSLDLDEIFWIRFRAALAVRGTLALLIGIVVFANLWVVTRSLGAIRVRRRYANIEIAERLPQAYVVSVISLVSLLSAWWLSAGTGDPIDVLAAFHADPWGTVDPIFGRDAAYYVFHWPILRRIQTLGMLLVFWAALLSVGAYVATGAIRVTESKPFVAPLARRHLGVLGSAFLVLYAANVWLDRYGLVIDGDGFAGGIGYTDVHARLPAKLIIFGLALLCAAALARDSWIGDFRRAAVAAALLAFAWIGGEAVYPSMIQRFVVEPNELPREAPFIGQHMDFTRSAFRLGEVEPVPLPYQSAEDLDEALLLENLSGIPLWDPRPLLTTYRQRQALYRYYTFTTVHHDRYGSRTGGREPVAISVRELDTAELETAAQTWQNLHLNYVAGEGAVASPVARMAGDGTPIFYMWDLEPPKVAPDAPDELSLQDPSIYFGEQTNEYVIVDRAAAPIGVPLDAGWKKVMFAWAFQSMNILFSSDLTRDSKFIYRRTIVDRVRSIAPFLTVSDDGGAYPVIADGRIIWIVDGYTTSTTFPLAPLVGFDGQGARYIRNSVKASVDAITGEVRLYAVDPADPVLATHARIFPGLIRPIEEMPALLRDHLRYPAHLMRLQAQVLGAYHLTDPRLFYEQQDVWALATEQYRDNPMTMEPTYSMFTLPGGDAPEFLLSVPFVPRGRQNMTALFVTRNDPPNYGEQILYQLPRDQVVLGPQQIEAMIDQDPEISQELALWRRGGSDVTRGHLMVVPVDSTLVYVEPLFLEAANAAIPQLERVILARPGRVVMQPTFESAVTALLSSQLPSVATGTEGDIVDGVPGTGRDPGVMSRARQLMQEAESLLRAGDWAGFGRAWESLRELVGEDGGNP